MASLWSELSWFQVNWSTDLNLSRSVLTRKFWTALNSSLLYGYWVSIMVVWVFSVHHTGAHWQAASFYRNRILSTRSELRARGQEPCEPISLSLARALSWEIGSQGPCSARSVAATLYPALANGVFNNKMWIQLNNSNSHFVSVTFG